MTVGKPPSDMGATQKDATKQGERALIVVKPFDKDSGDQERQANHRNQCKALPAAGR